MRPSLREVSIDFRISARGLCPVVIPFNAALGFNTEIGSNAATAAICSIVLLIFSFPLLGKLSRRAGAFVKDYVPCLSMPRRHTLEADGASAPTLFRCRGGDGKRLTGSDTKAACCPAVIEQTDPRSRR